ncbi:BLUF domain-containing protein [Burkholderiaceae bacterium]|nr:BLUF domain-containing protein [Burkholderiaceae bacterium]
MQNDEGQTVKRLHNIVYCSRAAHGVDKEALEKIIATARHHNPRFGITGLLVFGSGVFFQWLEGPKDNVTSLFKMISADARHSDVVLLTQEDEFRERLFPNWDMELVEAEDISAVLEDAMHEATDPRQKDTLSNMLRELNKSALGPHDT